MDKGHEETEKLLEHLEKETADTYRQAYAESRKKLDEYLRRFSVKDKIKRQQLESGEIDKAYYDYWRQGQILIGQRWEEMADTLAQDMHNTNEIARSMARDYMPDVYALNHNYSTYQIEHDARVDTSYTLYDRQTVERLMSENPKLLPDYTPNSRVAKRIAEGKDIKWNKQKINSALTQAVLQGESIENMSKRLAGVAQMNHNDSIRYARTMTTGAENAGRTDGYKRAESMGISLQKVWLATLDGRTRHSHRQLDGEKSDTDGKFTNGCKFPGDPDGPQSEVWNCRCTLLADIDGVDFSVSPDSVRRNSRLGDMSYEEWKEEHVDVLRRDYGREKVYEGENVNNQSIDNSVKSGIIKSRSIASRNLPNGLRTAPSHILTETEIESLKKDIASIEADESVFKFNKGHRTGYDDVLDEIRVKGDILPDFSSKHPRDRMSSRAALAHEYYGHRANRGTNVPNGAWNDEFRASYMAAKNCPNLSDEERADLILDALERAKESGVTIKNNDFIRRILYGY